MPHNATPHSASKPVHVQNVPRPSSTNANEGEGSRTAARNYNKATEQYVKSGRVEQAAKKAETALDGPEGDALREAELEARATVPSNEPRASKKNEPRASKKQDKPEEKSDEGFQEPDLMKDPSEDRE